MAVRNTFLSSTKVIFEYRTAIASANFSFDVIFYIGNEHGSDNKPISLRCSTISFKYYIINK